MEKAYHKPSNSIVELTEELKQKIRKNNTINEYYKILALPEHFSPQQLQDIADGRLKEGNYIVECELSIDEILCSCHPETCCHFDSVKSEITKQVKLNKDQHITLHQIEQSDILKLHIASYETVKKQDDWRNEVKEQSVEEAANKYSEGFERPIDIYNTFIAGAKWKEEQKS